MTIVDEHLISNVVLLVGSPPIYPRARPHPREILDPIWYYQASTAPITNDGAKQLVRKVYKGENIRDALIRTFTKTTSLANPPSSYTPPTSPGVFYNIANYVVNELPGLENVAQYGDTDSYENTPSGVYIPATGSIISTPYFPKDSKRIRNGVQGNSKNVNPRETTYLWICPPENDIVDPRTGIRTSALQPRPDGAVYMVPQPRNAKEAMKPIVMCPSVHEYPVGIRNGYNLNAFTLILGIVPGCVDNTNSPPPWRLHIRFGEITFKLEEGRAEAEIVWSGRKEAFRFTVNPGAGTKTTHHYGERPYMLTFIPVWNGLLISDSPPGSSNWADKVTYIQKDPSKNFQDGINKVLYPPYKWNVERNTIKPFPRVNNEASISPRDERPYGVYLPSREDAGSTIVFMGDQLVVDFHRCGGVLKFVPLHFPKNLKIHVLVRGTSESRKIPLSQLPTDTGSTTWIWDGFGFKYYSSTPCMEGYIPGPIPNALPFQTPQGQRVVVPCVADTPGGSKTYEWTGIEWIYLSGTCKSDRGYIEGEKPNPLPFGTPAGDRVTVLCQPDPNGNDSDVFNDVANPPVRGTAVLPMFHYQGMPNLELRSKLAKLPIKDNLSYNDMAIEFRRTNPDERLPVEIWGGLLCRYEENNLTFRNEDGFLTVNDVPESRIKSITINRSQDGTNGSIVWDRFDPITGLYTRPPQHIGGIRIGVSGGVDTVSGVIFTGLAMGNSQSNRPDSNEVNIPLYGKEAKLTEEGGLRLINVPFFDGYEHTSVLDFLCNYGGVPRKQYLTSTTFHPSVTPYRLPASHVIQESVVDFATGTPVWSAMEELGKLSGSNFYFDRFGELVYLPVASSTGVNWTYPDFSVETLDDQPDFTTLRNVVILSALVLDRNISMRDLMASNGYLKMIQVSNPVLMTLRLDTNPFFAWDKMMFYAINGVLPNQAEFNRVALQISKGAARPRAAGKVTIPGNAQIELLDTFNLEWFIAGISHSVDTQKKTFKTSLSLELILTGEATGTAEILPVASFE